MVMDTILVVRPRQVQFKWSFDQVTGTVSNTGNTWFKLLIKPSDEGRIPPQRLKNRLNDVEAIVNVTDELSHMHTTVFRRHGKVPGGLLTSGFFTN